MFEKRVLGVDLSHWQGHISSSSSIDPSEVQFAIVRAGHGTKADRMFNDHIRSACRHGLILGAYHYLETGKCPTEQAKFFVSQLETVGDIQLLPPVLDIEEGTWVPSAILEFLDTLEALHGKCPWIYTSHSFWSKLIGNNQSFSRYPLWIAHWGSNSPRIPLPWTDCVMWQYTNQFHVSWQRLPVDANLFNGDIDTLRMMATL